MKKGLFITFEGLDGSGKTTQIQYLKTYMEEKGFDAILTREPGGTRISEKIRTILLDKDHGEMDAMTEALLYAASRAQHVAEIIRPGLDSGKIVICDRFVDSSIAYQGYGRGLGNSIRKINKFAVHETLPDVTFFMKVDPQIGKKRIENEQLDRLELESVEYHNRVFAGYLELAKSNSERFVTIDATKSVEEIREKIKGHVDEIIARSKCGREI